MSSEQHDKLHKLLSSLQPLEPRAGLEQQILQRIQQEPQFDQPAPSRKSKWLMPAAAVTSFVACLVLVLGYIFHVNPTTFQSSPSTAGSMPSAHNGIASQEVNQAAKDAESNAANGGALADSAKGVKRAGNSGAEYRQQLSQGLVITMSAPAKQVNRQTADNTQWLLSPDDFKGILTELNKAGAQWVAINDVPVTAADPMEWKNNALYVHGSLLQAPYEVSVSGDPTALRNAIEQKGSYINWLQIASKVSLSIDTVDRQQ